MTGYVDYPIFISTTTDIRQKGTTGLTSFGVLSERRTKSRGPY